ncbi:29663_t:CDS:2 [Gigaspora margarita]|uniref:29663_t:CDS:1 n=1 Tax=Gigaspora margarita TaxID=4874 RepID=A0ABN7W5Q8_GIGMA|nr:29663_t:CDS:2 [Gigaspora margarita]
MIHTPEWYLDIAINTPLSPVSNNKEKSYKKGIPKIVKPKKTTRTKVCNSCPAIFDHEEKRFGKWVNNTKSSLRNLCDCCRFDHGKTRVLETQGKSRVIHHVEEIPLPTCKNCSEVMPLARWMKDLCNKCSHWYLPPNCIIMVQTTRLAKILGYPILGRVGFDQFTFEAVISTRVRERQIINLATRSSILDAKFNHSTLKGHTDI